MVREHCPRLLGGDMSDREPELRGGPPWVMEDMIHAELGLPAQISAEPAVSLVQSGSAKRRRPARRSWSADVEPASTLLALFRRSSRTPCPPVHVVARDSFEVHLDPPDGGLVIAVSHAAGTAATRDAATGAVGRGARVLFITACPEDAPEAVDAVGTPLYDASWCHTVAYVSPILTCALGAGLEAEIARRLIDSELAKREQRRVDAIALARCDRLLIVGSGVDEITASELALKLEEAAHVPCTPLGTEKVLHGHLPAADAQTGLVLIRCDPSQARQRDDRTANVASPSAFSRCPLSRSRDLPSHRAPRR